MTEDQSNSTALPIRYISTEEPIVEEWRLLTQFTYKANVERYSKEQQIPSDSRVSDYISGCYRQGKAYFEAARNTTIDISPLLVYYGATNLLAGTSALTMGMVKKVDNHGMKFEIPEEGRIADSKITPVNDKTGALQVFSNVFSNKCRMVNGASWNLLELLGSIPDLNSDYNSCYPTEKPFVARLEQYEVEETRIERIELVDLKQFEDPAKQLKDNVLDYSKSYLEPQVAMGTHLVLNPKINAPDIGIYSVFGRKYLQFLHLKNGNKLVPDQIIIIFMALFSLGYLSRYYPQRWNAFVQSDDTGERLLVERFVDLAIRFFPNLLLNFIEKKRVQFTLQIEQTRVVDTYTSARGTE